MDRPLTLDIANKAAELSSAFRELGAVRAQLAEARAQAWWQNTHLGVTERRETVHATVAEFTAETEKLTAEVEALKVELKVLMEFDHGV